MTAETDYINQSLIEKDFKDFTRLENPFLPFNRNAVLFPRKINGKYIMLSRPSDSGHTPFGDILLSQSSFSGLSEHKQNIMIPHETSDLFFLFPS